MLDKWAKFVTNSYSLYSMPVSFHSIISLASIPQKLANIIVNLCACMYACVHEYIERYIGPLIDDRLK